MKYSLEHLNEKKILIFGYGRIGKKVATICKFFNMQVYVYDKFIDNSEINKEFCRDKISFEDVGEIDASTGRVITIDDVGRTSQGFNDNPNSFSSSFAAFGALKGLCCCLVSHCCHLRSYLPIGLPSLSFVPPPSAPALWL